MKTKAYLDSSVILTRDFGYDSEKNIIDHLIQDAEKYASRYAKMEIWRTFLKDAIYLHSLVLEEKNLPNVLQRISSIGFRPRIKDRCIKLLAKVSDDFRLRVEDATARLELLIEGMENLLFNDVHLLSTGTCCPLAEEKVQKETEGYTLNTRCTRHEPDCKVAPFFMKKAQTIDKLKQYLEANKIDHLKKLIELLNKIRENPEIAKGRNCMILGDLIICMDALNGLEIFSTNVKDFEPICSALRKKFKAVYFK